MTDSPSTLNTYTAPLLNANTLPNGGFAQAVDSAASPIEEEEDYTIKCFCGFQLDDGNTVFCDRCETWQHIECYYFEDYRNGHAPDVASIEHACVDCSPRSYDKKSAVERQRERFMPGERKVKKVSTKPIKRRAKLSEPNASVANGYSHEGYDQSIALDRTSGSPRDQGPPTKRPKTSHRNSGSINLHAGPLAQKPVSSRKASKNTGQHPSVNEYCLEPPSPEFLRLHDYDSGDASLLANIFNDIAITRSLSLWSHDVEALSLAANGLTQPQIFHRLSDPLDSVAMPQLRKEHRVDTSIEIEGRHPQWTFLTTENGMAQESIVGELCGRIGHMQDYCQDNANRWDYLRHPAPFVFFHPKLPIYIDTRQAGSICRYLRRSCRPNVELRTILEDGSDYRFIFIAKENLEAGTELTISWTTDEHIRRWMDQLSNPIKQEGTVDADLYVSDWVQKVLSNFGGCACESVEQCGLVKWLRPRDGSNTSNGTLSNGKPWKGRNGHMKANTTPDIGNGINSRASSEGMKRSDDEDHDNSRSVSGSKTPTRYGFGVPSLEISDRDKRKIAAVEKNFEQLEQERQQPAHKRKKRSSGGSNLNTPTVAASVRTPLPLEIAYYTNIWGQKQLGHGSISMSQPNTPSMSTSRPHYADASTTRKMSGSPVARYSQTPFKRPNSSAKRSSHPNTPSIKSPLTPYNYVHSSVQTDFDKSDESDHPAAPQGLKKRVYISLGKRLLMRCQQDREQAQKERRKSMDSHADATPSEGIDEQNTVKTTSNHPAEQSVDLDMEMKDVAESLSLALPDESSPDRPVEKPRPPDKDSVVPDLPSTEIKPPPPPSIINSTPVMSSQGKPINGFRSAELRVQLPSTNHYSHDPASAPPMAATMAPTIGRSSFSHTPNSYPPLFSSSTPGAVAPSPVKKVSLEEYFTRRKTESQIPTNGKAAGSSPTTCQGTNTIKGLGHGEDEGKVMLLEVNGVADSPREVVEPLFGRKASAP